MTISARFRPSESQRWSIFAGFNAAMGSRAAKAELRGWCGLALLSLGIAGLFAFLVALSRVPGIDKLAPLPVSFFGKGLVVHVIFSFIVWYLSMLGALTVVAAYRLGDGSPLGSRLGWAAIIFGYSAAVMLFVPGFLDRGEPSLNNYVPVILDPLFYAGLTALTFAILLTIARVLISLIYRTGPLEPISLGITNASILFIVAILCIVMAGTQLTDSSVDDVFFENLFWGGGHVLQFVNVGMLITAWYLLGGLALQMPVVKPNYMRLAQIFLLIPATLAPLIYIFFEAFEFRQNSAFTLLQFAFLPPTLIMVFFGIRTLAYASFSKTDINIVCLLLSAGVFGLGGTLGLFIDGADTRTPAHYHGVLGGINLAFMGLFYGFFLPLMGRVIEATRSMRFSVWFYAIGQSLHVLGLFLAGGYGAPRKTAGAAWSIDSLGAQLGLYGLGVGAVIAVIGGVMFIWIGGKALISRAK